MILFTALDSIVIRELRIRLLLFHSSYTGNKYKLYFAAGINNLTSYENGGITDMNLLDQANTRDVPVNLGGLNNAKSILKNRNLLLVQRYTIGRQY